MTVNEIHNYYDLMYQSSVEKQHQSNNGSTNNTANIANSNSYLPSIVISTLSGPNVNSRADIVTVAANVHHNHHRHRKSVPREQPEVMSCASSTTTSATTTVVSATVDHIHNVPICVEPASHDTNHREDDQHELDKRLAPARPTTLSTGKVNNKLNTPKTPEFSISPADSISKASSNEQLSSNMFLPKLQTPRSPSSLSVNFCYNGNMVLSPSFNSLHGSLASSINDLTVEVELLEKAIRHNDVKFVSRALEIYLGKLSGDKQSQSTRRTDSQDSRPNRPVLRSQSAFDEQHPQQQQQQFSLNDSIRRSSASTEERENMTIFTNALHTAIENNAYDVTVLMLKHGVDPNEPGVAPYTFDYWRRSSHTSEDSNVVNQDRLNLTNMVCSTSREPLIRTPSIRTANSPMLLSPLAGPSFFGGGGGGSTTNNNPTIYFSANSSPSSINSDLSSMCHYQSTTKLIRLRAEMSAELRLVYCKSDGSPVSYDEEYVREKLFTLPPIYLAVALNNSVILRELIRFGANVNATDSHGVTPLHLCLCQEHISRACLHLLVQSGAKLKVKNNQLIAPFELVDPDLCDEVVDLQKSLIDELFTQMVPQSKTSRSRKRDSIFSSHRVLPRDQSNNSINLAVLSKHFAKEESLESNSSGTNLTKFFESKLTGGGDRRGGGKEKQLSKQSSKNVQICLDDYSDHLSDSPATGTAKTLDTPSGPSTLFSGIIGHKRSFACDSHTANYLKNNLSQSSLQLCGNEKQHSGTFTIGGRSIFGRRRSGDDNAKSGQQQPQKPTKPGAFSRTNTQDEPKMDDSLQLMVESSLTVLCKMSSNGECIHLIIANLRKHLPEIISLNESSSNTMLKLHHGLSRLFNRLLQCIVDSYYSSRDQIIANSVHHSESKSTPPTTAANHQHKRHHLNNSELELISLKQEMSIQLCGLLICALCCLKGGQTFQYTSLLIVNLIIDFFVRCEASLMPLNGQKLFNCDLEWCGGGGGGSGRANATTANATGITDANVSNVKSPGDKSEKYSSAINAAATNIGKHIRNLRLNESFNFKQNKTETKSTVAPSISTNTTEKSKTEEKKKTSEQQPQSKLVSWIKQVHLSPKLSHHKQLHMINELLHKRTGHHHEESGSGTNYTGSKEGGKESSVSAANATTEECTNFVQILVNEGLDLILNVLNNAITLHKRVSGSKQSCLPSRRSRQCIYHCLQILSARAILYSSQNEDAQKRLITEGPLKVLISAIDSTHDPQLICLALQIIANLAINSANHQKLIEVDIADCLMQLILPSDEWFYTNHSTKYAKFVKHHAARVMVYLGLEKRLRNKVYLFDLMEDLGLHSPPSESAEDSYIIHTSVSPNAIYSASCPKLLIGSSVEGILLDLIKQVEDKIVNGEDSLCIDPLNDETYLLDNLADIRTIKADPPAIQVDMPSGFISDRRLNSHPNCFFYLSTLPMTLQPVIALRVLQHQMFGCIAFWAWHSNAVSRASVASVGGSSVEFNRSRASSNASNTNFEISNAFNLKRNLNLYCSNSSLSPGRIDVERRPSVKGLMDNRLTLQNSLPVGATNFPKGIQISNSLSTLGQGHNPSFVNKLPVQAPLQRLSLIEQQLHQHIYQQTSLESQPVDSPTEVAANPKRFRFSSLRRNRHSSFSTENNSTLRNNSLDTTDRNEAYILAFQRELQNLPKNESPSPVFGAAPVAQTDATNSLAAFIRETFELMGTPLKRPRSCSVPRITLENFSSTLLQLPGAAAAAAVAANSSLDKNQLLSNNNPLIRSATSDVSYSNAAPHVINSGTNPSLSPIKVSGRNLNESPISCASTFRSTSRSGSRSGSAGQVITESIMPNAHKAILKLLLDWVSLCPSDFKYGTSRRELADFLNRVSMIGDQYRWMVDEIRIHAAIDDKNSLIESPSGDSAINKEYKALQKLILSGELPCSKEEAAILAVIQLRIEETSPQTKEDERRQNLGQMLPSSSMRQNSIIEEKLRPICEDVKETSPIESEASLNIVGTVNMSSSFDELEEDGEEDVKYGGGASGGGGGVGGGGGAGGHHSRMGAVSGTSAFTAYSGSGQSSSHSGGGQQQQHSVSTTITTPPAPGSSIGFLPTLTKKTTSRLCHWVTSNWTSRGANFASIDVRECLPPIYHNTKNIVKTIREQKRKLFHTPIYESEQQLKKLYIQTCKRLPAFGCRIFQVKELLHGKTNRRATRLLGICLDRIVLLDCKTLQPAKIQTTTNLQQWRTGGGRSHDRLVLEFRGTKWSFVTASNSSLRAIGTVLWEIMQDLDACFLDTLIAGERYEHGLEDSGKSRPTSIEYYGFSKTMHFREELQRLEALLHFPEEVAMRLGDIEYELFYNIEPVYYIRQVTVELNNDRKAEMASGKAEKIQKSFTVKELIERFNEVSSWVTHIIISQPTHEMRKAILSCIMRVVQSCWNLGNFNSAVEILAGLKSEKLKPFWLSIEQKDEPFLRRKLSDILLTLDEPSEQYKSAVIRALDIPHSKVIPFFGAFLRDLKTILQQMPSLIVLANEHTVQQSMDTNTLPITRIESISEFNGEDNYMSRIGVGGIINMNKMYKTHQVLDNIRAFHIHSIRRNQLIAEMKCRSATDEDMAYLFAADATAQNNLYYQLYCDQLIESELMKMDSKGKPQALFGESKKAKCDQTDLYQVDLDSYKPIQQMPKSHRISIIPLDVNSIDYHVLQSMHHGMTIVHFEEDTGRSSIVYAQLEQSNSTLAWSKPYWSTSLRSSGNTPQDYQLSFDIEETVLTGVTMKYETKEPAMIGLDEGYLDLMFLKDIVVGQSGADLTLIARRHGLPEYILSESSICSIKLLFGVNLSDNRTLEFIAPKCVASIWVDGLRNVLRLIQKQKKLCDQRILWLKEKYLQLYYEDCACVGPTPAEAIRVFGGRKWTIDAMGASHQSLQIDSNAKSGTNSAKMRKKKSTVSLAVIRDYSTRSQLSIYSEPDATVNSARSNQQSPSSGIRHKTSTKSQTQIRSQSDQTNENIGDSQSSLSSKTSSSCDNVAKSFMLDHSPIHTSLLTAHYREKFCKKNSSTLLDSFGSPKMQARKLDSVHQQTPKHKMAITHSTHMNFVEFSELFRSFLICIRRDIKDIFEQIASKSDIHTFKEAESNFVEEDPAGKQKKPPPPPSQSPAFEAAPSMEKKGKDVKFLGLLTRNTDSELNEEESHRARIFDAIATASIVTNSAGIDTLKTSVLTATDFYAFILTYQCEDLTLDDVKRLIQIHEPNTVLRKRNCLSFEGFARYLMDKNNFAYTPEMNEVAEEDMNYPISHYYIASSHNTYLTGHQLKGESSVELYSQVLLTGCRCVELDCWDGDDGMPVIYHGHTLTSKIPFKKVVETINDKAFAVSPYPVILSVENHCSLQQQAKMAQIFLSVFGEKLVTKFLFETDYADEPQLPSPNQLKYRILIKNKKLRAPLHTSVNLKMRINLSNKATNGRTNSLVSNISTGSLNEDDDDEYDEDDDDDDVDECGTAVVDSALDKKADEDTSARSKSSSQSSKQKHSDHHAHEVDNTDVVKSPFVHSKVVRKSSSQIAPELSDLVIYCQAIKFRGLLNTSFNLSPTNSTMSTPISKKMASRKALTNATFNSTIQASTSLLPVIESNKIKEELRELNISSPTFQNTSIASSTNASMNKRPNSSAPCYQVSSINENTAKKLCRKSPLAVIAHTESQIMRTYPAGMRIDSSNFNPVIFWAFGIQSVALNYQTVDTALHINSAMFEQNGGCGYVMKTDVMRDKFHMMFGRFNPWEKEFDGLHTINLTITIISGQYVCPNTNIGSPQVEVEIIGIPVDCNRQRTKIVQRNSLNPIWNDTFFFRIKFVDLAFLRVTVTDVGTNHLSAQRVLPVKSLKQGYRHLRLHNPHNQSLPLSTVFIYSSYEEEGLDMESDTSSDKSKAKSKITRIDLNRLDAHKIDATGTAPVKRRMFFLVVHGVMAEEPSTILKITQDSTVTDVISQALTKANKPQESVNDYVLLEEVTRGWEKKRSGDRNVMTQRILDPTERPLEAQNNWKGEGRFILKKLADDPSTRAWMTTIRSSSANKERNRRQDQGCSRTNEEIIADWEDETENETFLVCIFNVSEDQPYTILKASVASSAQDIITQALLKAHRKEDPKTFVIVEEVENFSDTSQTDSSSSFSFKSKSGTGYRRVVGDFENIYDVQTHWKNKGKFELKYRKEITPNDNTNIKQSSSPSTSKLLRNRGSLKKLSQIHRTYSKRLQRRDNTGVYSDSPTPSRKSTPQNQPEAAHSCDNESPIPGSGSKAGSFPETDESRQAHSEGEIPSDTEDKSVSSLSRLKKLSLKRLKVWKS